MFRHLGHLSRRSCQFQLWCFFFFCSSINTFSLYSTQYNITARCFLVYAMSLSLQDFNPLFLHVGVCFLRRPTSSAGWIKQNLVKASHLLCRRDWLQEESRHIQLLTLFLTIFYLNIASLVSIRFESIYIVNHGFQEHRRAKTKTITQQNNCYAWIMYISLLWDLEGTEPFAAKRWCPPLEGSALAGPGRSGNY